MFAVIVVEMIPIGDNFRSLKDQFELVSNSLRLSAVQFLSTGKSIGADARPKGIADI